MLLAELVTPSPVPEAFDIAPITPVSGAPPSDEGPIFPGFVGSGAPFPGGFVGGVPGVPAGPPPVIPAPVLQPPDTPPISGVPGGVPEPSAWALMLLGVATIGAALRR